jgi:hypothetical protein
MASDPSCPRFAVSIDLPQCRARSLLAPQASALLQLAGVQAE